MQQSLRMMRCIRVRLRASDVTIMQSSWFSRVVALTGEGSQAAGHLCKQRCHLSRSQASTTASTAGAIARPNSLGAKCGHIRCANKLDPSKVKVIVGRRFQHHCKLQRQETVCCVTRESQSSASLSAAEYPACASIAAAGLCTSQSASPTRETTRICRLLF